MRFSRPVHFSLPTTEVGRCLQQVRIHPGITRRQLQSELGLTQPTTARLISRMEAAGLVRFGEPNGGADPAGRPSAGIYIHGAGRFAVGAHIGRRVTQVVLTDLSGATLAEESVALDIAEASPEDFLEAVAWRMARLAADAPAPVKHIGLAFSADVSDDGTITSATYGWQAVPALELADEVFSRVAPAAHFAPEWTLEIGTGVAAMAGYELAHTDLATGHTLSSLYVYAREVLGYAWIIHGAVHRPRLGHQSPLIRQLVEASPLDAFARPRGIDPLSVSALLGTAHERDLVNLVRRARTDPDLAALLDHRADILRRIIAIAVQVVDPAAVVLAGETFTADPARTRRIAAGIGKTSGERCALKTYSAQVDIIAQAATMTAVHAAWHSPLDDA
ncbi:ROK family transcriptional regulator [Corynebacterium sanguinis]|uniref:ROK family transcriptional regulator n=1 Tax=Corynebacterium sanguinis TaxID=2594913 RepID=UPI00223B316D|nr:ROK family transcriptional regulator [Corynebacterium sanguinis]MCT1556295.1 ROK family transcriptional regulator [Corynebacterium sanguinis]MCT1664930.1 ROK family transcriptional regulator [Corynebacterium sanguinis]MCT1883495.1 ROK family transcriptional regulator [Corynebacterium sanguinis]MDN8623162.1 MarR family transcriptional regulator [Corynebacterium sanguinis]